MVSDLGIDVDVKADYYGTPLMFACHFSSIKVIQKLLELGADVNKEAGIHGYALHTAAHVRSAIDRHQVLQLLLDAGADILLSTAEGNVLHALALRGRFRGRAEDAFETANMLICAGADVNFRRQSDGRSPLELAVLNLEVGIVQALANEADLISCQEAMDALHEGSVSSMAPASAQVEDTERAEIGRMLIERGCNPGSRTPKAEKSALEIAAEMGHSFAVEQLLRSDSTSQKEAAILLVAERLSSCSDLVLENEYKHILELLQGSCPLGQK